MAQSRNTRGSSRAKRSYKWCGDAITRVPETFVSTTAAEVIVLCPAVGPEDYSDVLLERTIIQFHIRRILTSDVNAFSAVVATQPLDQTSTTNPAQVLDALTLVSTEYGAKNILKWGGLPVPPRISREATFNESAEVVVREWDIKVKRRLDRERQLLTLSMNTDVSSVLSVFVQWRVLLSYGKR